MSDWRGEWFRRSGTCVWTFPFPCHNRLGVTEGRQDKRHTAINKCTVVYKHIIKKETLINTLSGLGDPKSFQRYAAISLCCWGFHMPQYKTTFFWNSGISVYMVRRHNHCESISNTTRNSPKKKTYKITSSRLQHHVHVFLNCQEETSCTLHELLEWFQWSNEGLLILYIYDMCSVQVVPIVN